MYSVNEMVLYGADGVCTITNIVEKNMLGTARLFYELHPVSRRDAVLFLPTDNEKTMAKLRRVLTREEIISAIRSMPDEENIWIDKESERREAYARIIRSGDHKKVIRLIKTLYEHRESLMDGQDDRLGRHEDCRISLHRSTNAGSWCTPHFRRRQRNAGRY